LWSKKWRESCKRDREEEVVSTVGGAGEGDESESKDNR
jgi:hypothetical protein